MSEDDYWGRGRPGCALFRWPRADSPRLIVCALFLLFIYPTTICPSRHIFPTRFLSKPLLA